MDIINLLPAPGSQFLQLFLRLALSLFNSMVNRTHRKPIQNYRSLSDFDIDVNTGFFPSRPLPQLPNEFSIWEGALRDANGKLCLGKCDNQEALEKRAYGDRWRSRISSWPVLDIDALCHDHRLLQRAHFVLSWTVNLYAHSSPPPQDGSPLVIPKSIAVPLVAVSKCLGLAPVLTFADTVLWNWEAINPNQPWTMENMRCINLFSGTEDERSFYMASMKAELRGVEMLRLLDSFYTLPNVTDLTSISKLSRDLAKLAGVIEDISEVLHSVRPTCDPHVFYFDIRPWFVGSDREGLSGPRWVYEGVEDSDNLDLSGPSAGQSSVMHALDIFLDIDHKLGQRRVPAPSDANKRADHGFMERMRRYMPGKHREFLTYVASNPRSIRDLAQTIPALRDPYDTAVLALKRFRDMHMRIACLYIVSMSHSTSARCPVSAMMKKVEASNAGKGPARGTGGNELSLLLKAGRDATRRAVLKNN